MNFILMSFSFFFSFPIHSYRTSHSVTKLPMVRFLNLLLYYPIPIILLDSIYPFLSFRSSPQRRWHSIEAISSNVLLCFLSTISRLSHYSLSWFRETTQWKINTETWLETYLHIRPSNCILVSNLLYRQFNKWTSQVGNNGSSSSLLLFRIYSRSHGWCGQIG